MQENKKRISFIVFIGILLIGNVFFGLNYFKMTKDLKEIKSAETNTELNEKVLNFTAMFIKKVLQADKEVNFETRLSLENAVREIKDEQIISEWQNFVESKTEIEAQESVKKLLEILISKIQK